MYKLETHIAPRAVPRASPPTCLYDHWLCRGRCCSTRPALARELEAAWQLAGKAYLYMPNNNRSSILGGVPYYRLKGQAAVALDARQPSLWTSVIDRVQCVLVWSRPLCSGSSPRTSGMLVWWVPWQVVWAGPGHVGRCTKDIGVVGSASASLGRVWRRREDFIFFGSSLRTSSCAQNALLRRVVTG